MSCTENNLFYDKENSKSIWDKNNKILNLHKTLQKIRFATGDEFWFYYIYFIYALLYIINFSVCHQIRIILWGGRLAHILEFTPNSSNDDDA